MIVNANSQKEALEIALKELGGNVGDLTFKILKTPKNNNLLNLIRKTGIYEISSLNVVQTPVETSPSSSSYVSIQGGKITVYNPSEEENSPILYINNDCITLTVNDRIIKSHIALKENDVISITFDPIEPITHVTLSLSENNMEATLNVIKKSGKTFYLKDMDKTNRGYLDIDWVEVLPEKVTLQQCLELLENAHIQECFIDIDSIKLLIDEPSSCSKVVAKGTPLKESQAAEVTYSPLFTNNLIDGLEPIVQKGETIALKKNIAIMGTAGMTLLGQELIPKNVKDVLLQAGEGALVVEDETRVISAIIGRPYFEKGIITVVPVQYVNGDLSKEIGDIHFEGDVIVKGNVLDEISIYATGNVEISGSAYNARIIAQKSVQIQGKAIGCKIQAGAEKSKLYLASVYFEDINHNIIEMFQKIKAIEPNHSQTKVNTIHKYKELIEKHIKNINGISDLMEKEDNIKVDTLLKNLRNSLMQITLLKETGFKMLLNIYNELIDILAEIKTFSVETVCLTLSYAQCCELNSCGNIILTGKGSYQTNMVAQNEIIYSTPMSVIRGGIIIAGSKITAGIVGTLGEIYTECRVLREDGTIKGNYYSGTVVYIHNEKQDIATI